MKNLLKYPIRAGAILALTGSVYAVPTLYITDGAGIGGSADLVSSPSGSVVESVSDTNWAVVVAEGTASPPYSGGGTAQLPHIDVSIVATYVGNGTNGNPLNIYFGSDGFGPSSTNFAARLTGNVVSGTGLAVHYTTWVAPGSALPTVVNPIPTVASTLTSSGAINPSNVGGSFSNLLVSGPIVLDSYSLGENITILGASSGSGYSLDASIAVSAPSVTPPSPSLSITLSGEQVVLTWPASATGYILQATTNLPSSAANWSTVSPAPIVINAQNTVSNSLSANQMFYRLSQ